VASILVIEDSETHRAEIRRVIDRSGLFDRVLEASDGIKGLKLLVSETVDVVLCDLEMPGLDGEKLLRVKAATPGRENLPFLFLTASSDVGRRARLLETGACDAVLKPFHPVELIARLGLHLKLKRLQDELRVKNSSLARLSTLDELTGLRTRRYVCDLLSVELMRARRYRTPLAVLMADLDHFKQVNDGHGHLAGDAVLRGVAQRLFRSLRATDTAGRYGGEELLVVLPHNNAAGASVLGERWRQAVELEPFETGDAVAVSVTLSAGVAEFHPEIECPEDLIGAADAALYRAKDQGRNRVVIS
jgi:diguanylate cyclase (GGDEF)-like protein